MFTGSISNQAYQLKKQSINILHKSGKIEDIVKASDQLNLKALSKNVSLLIFKEVDLTFFLFLKY